MMNKIAITGHTRGIGRALYQVFSNNNQVVGFSSSNGFDISIEQVRNNILSQCKDYDIFINNAYDPVGQLDLLKKLIELWEGKNKLIINMSSKLVFYPGPTNEFFDQYINSKKEQNNVCSKRFYSDNPKVLNIMPGLVETDMSKVFTSKKMDCAHLANFVYDIVKHKDMISTQQLIIDVPGLNWSDVKVSL